MTQPYKINDAVLLSREREGIIRYVGKVHFSNGIWCGIELVGGSLGTNDGQIHGRRYFSCAHNRGLFCKLNKVRRKFRARDHSASSRQKRKASLEQRLYHKSIVQKVLQSELELKKKYDRKRYNSKCQAPYTVDVGNIQITNSRPTVHTKANWLNERMHSTPTKELIAKSHKPKIFKPGPRDIGRIENWKPIEYNQNDHVHSQPISKRKQRHKMYKAGPRDIGRTKTNGRSGWTPIELTQEEERRLNEGYFLDDRKSTKRVQVRKNGKKGRKVFKAGPRDIGRNNETNWRPIELSKAAEKRLNAGSFLDERLSSSSSKKRSKTGEHGKIFKAGPRDIGRNTEWKQKRVKTTSPKKKRKQKQLTIAVNNENVNPNKLRRSRKENKALMKGKQMQENKVEKKNKYRKDVYKQGPRDIGRNNQWKQTDIVSKRNRRQCRQKKTITERERNESVFDSFRMDRKHEKTRNNGYDSYSNYSNYNKEEQAPQRQSVLVELNRGNQAKRQKHIINKYPKLKQRHSEKRIPSNMKKMNGYIHNAIHNTAIVSNAKYTPYNVIRTHRNSVHEHTNYHNFTAYNPNNEENENTRDRNYSASHESDSIDLGEDDVKESNDDMDHKESVYELFGHGNTTKECKESPKLSGAVTPPTIEHFEEEEALDTAVNGSQSYDDVVYDSSPSGHDRLFEFDIVGSPPMRPKAHVHAVEDRVSLTAALFSDDDDDHIKHIRQYNAPNKPLPPSKASPKKRKGRIKGIAVYTDKWSVSFKEMKPVIDIDRVLKKRKRSRSRARARASSRAKKKNSCNEEIMNAFIFTIYKDGSVQIEPKTAFGWNGIANIAYDVHASHSTRTYSVYPVDLKQSDEYEYISMNRNGTLHIEHFNASNNSIKPVIGVGVRC